MAWNIVYRDEESAGGDADLIESWLYRSTLAGTFRSLRFDTAAAVDNFRFTSGVGLDQSPSSGMGLNVRRNATEGIIGDGALELEQLTSDNMSSYLWLPFDSSKQTWQFNETGFNRGPGEEFYVQVAMKSNCGGSAGTNGEGRKNFSVTRLTASYTANELVVQDTLYRGIIQMYSGYRDGVAYNPVLEDVGGGDFDLQPGGDYATPPDFCSYADGDYINQSGCATYFNGEWITYLMHVIPATDGASNGTLELSIWKSGWSAYKKIVSQTGFEMNYDSDKPDGYNAFIAWIYETGRSGGPSNQKQWYDQIILSRNYIPCHAEVDNPPTWWTSQTTSEWAALSGGSAPTLDDVNPCPAENCSYSATEGQAGLVDDWCGAAASPNSLIIAAQGGHLGYAGNELYEFVFDEESPRWYRRIDPSTSVQQEVAYYADGKPTSRHGYAHDCFIGTGTNGNRWFSHHGSAVYGNGGTHVADAASWPIGTSSYEAQDAFPDFPGDTLYDNFCAYDPVGHKVWVQEGGLNGNWRVFSLDIATKTWTTYGSSSTALQDGDYMAALIDPVRRVIVGQTGNTLYIRDLAFPNDSGRVYTVSGLSGNAIAYEPVSGKWVSWNGGKTLRAITPPSNYRTGDGTTQNGLNSSASYSVGQTITPSGGATPTSANTNGTYGRFNYIAKPRGFCVVNSTTESMYFFKIPEAGI